MSYLSCLIFVTFLVQTCYYKTIKRDAIRAQKAPDWTVPPDKEIMDQLEEIKSKIDTVEFIQSYIPLKKAGRNFRGLCPFHTEKTPSFMISPERQIWHCFGCGEGGDVFGFLMKMEGLEFGEALRILAQKTGVQIKSQAPGMGEKKERLYAMNRLAGLVYQKILLETKAGESVLSYLGKRKIKKSTIREFGIGFASPKGTILVDLLNKKGFKNQEILNSGLALVRRGKIIDLFRNRIVFPLRNLHGDIVGFTGRSLTDDIMPKYLNTPQTLIFDKGRILYGLSLAKEEIRKNDLAILVEGQMDVLSSYQEGVKNVVCSSGTALTEAQIDLIKRFTENVALAFDKDEAGEKASKRSIDLLLNKGINVQVIVIPCGADPDECIRKNSKAWQTAIKKPIPIMDFYFQSVFDKINKRPQDLTPSEKKKISQQILPEIKKIVDKIEKSAYMQKLGNLLDVDDQVIADAIKDIQDFKYKKTEPTEKRVRAKENQNLSEELLLGLTIKFYNDVKNILMNTDLDADDFSDDETKSIYKDLQTFVTVNELFNKDKFLKDIDDKKSKRVELCLMTVDHFYEDIDEKEIYNEIEMLIKRIKRKNYYQQKKIIERSIKEAESKKDKKKVKNLIDKLKKIIDKEKR